MAHQGQGSGAQAGALMVPSEADLFEMERVLAGEQLYQFTADMHDFVMLPGGQLGRVIDVDYEAGFHVKAVRVEPLKRRWWQYLVGIPTFRDEEINQLRLVVSGVRVRRDECAAHRKASGASSTPGQPHPHAKPQTRP